MPLHLESMTSNYDNSSILAWILSQVNIAELGYASKNSDYIHLFKPFMDSKTNNQIGRIVFTLKNNNAEKRLEVLDVDIVFENPGTADLSFLSLKDGSSDANEYYEVELQDDKDVHMDIETVNRHMIEEDISGTIQSVHLCAFPFKLTLYDSMDELNRALGFSKPIKVKGTDLELNGYSDEFLATGEAFGAKKGESFSFVIGRINDYREVMIQMSEDSLSFILANVITGAGIMPVPMGKDVFNLQNLHEGSYVAMYADVKADFADAYQKNLAAGKDGTERKETPDNNGDKGFLGKLKKLFVKND